MFVKTLIISLALASGLIGFAGADSSGVITSTRIFSNVQGGEPLTLVTTITASATALAPLPPGVFLATIPANHAPPEIYTRTSSNLPPGAFVATISAVYTLSSEIPTTTITTTNLFTSTFTVTQPANTITVHVTDVYAKPSLVTGMCYWGQGGVAIPCTYTASNIPNNISPTAIYASNNGTRPNGSGVITSTPSSAAISSHANPIKFLVDGVKYLASRDALEPTHVDWDKLDNATRNDNTSEPEFDKYRDEYGVHWTKCDHVPVLWGPSAMAILFLLHSIVIRFRWNKPSRNQNHNARLVIFFMAFWGVAFPAFVYIEIYTSVNSAWRDCIPDPNRTYPY